MDAIVFDDIDSAGQEAAAIIAHEACSTVAQRGRFVLAVSGGQTPLPMFRALAAMSVPWEAVHVVQVDERVAPMGHPDRNFTHLQQCLIGRVPLRPENVHAMPVESPDLNGLSQFQEVWHDSKPPPEGWRRRSHFPGIVQLHLDAATVEYARAIERIAGIPPVLDLVHLGLGSDGHTASLVPGDAALDVSAADVALSGVYQGRRRMTLTYPILNRARRIVWLVSGGEKAAMLERLCNADPSIPAGRIRQDVAVLLADRAAARA